MDAEEKDDEDIDVDIEFNPVSLHYNRLSLIEFKFMELIHVLLFTELFYKPI